MTKQCVNKNTKALNKILNGYHELREFGDEGRRKVTCGTCDTQVKAACDSCIHRSDIAREKGWLDNYQPKYPQPVRLSLEVQRCISNLKNTQNSSKTKAFSP